MFLFSRELVRQASSYCSDCIAVSWVYQVASMASVAVCFAFTRQLSYVVSSARASASAQVTSSRSSSSERALYPNSQLMSSMSLSLLAQLLAFSRKYPTNMSSFLFSAFNVKICRYSSVNVGISTVVSSLIISFRLHLGAAELYPGGGISFRLFSKGEVM